MFYSRYQYSWFD